MVGRKAGERGFSLVELMVVISIIGLLAGIVAFNVIKQGVKAKRMKVKADVSTFDKAIKLYKSDTGKWPQQLEDLSEEIDDMSKAVIDPWGNHYVYQYTGSGDPPYRLGSYGADGQPGGEGDNADVFPHEQ